MGEKRRVITRRDFIRAGSCLAMGTLIGFPLMGSSPVEKREKSRVVLVRDNNVLDRKGNLRPDILENMFDKAFGELFDTSEPLTAWRQLVGPDDVVGIKSNAWGYLPTPESLESAIRNRLMAAGVMEKNIGIDDRGVRGNPVFQRATALINVRPMRTHHWSGLGTLLKNYIMFVPTPSMYHGNACEKLGAIWTMPQLKGKTRLNILVMLTPLFHGIGPHHFSPQYTWPYCGLILSTDPVAADATGARIIQVKRNAFFKTERPISPPALHIAAADTRFGLGNSHPDQIQLIKLGWDEGILI
ncbi:MAG: DUF362 domain-containing protein [Pseudomonadota bacterium]